MTEKADKRDLIEILESFNRKERFFLLAQALNDKQGNPKLYLSEEFRKKLSEEIKIDIPSERGEGLFVGIDYHLDWIAAAIAYWEGARLRTKIPNQQRTGSCKDFVIEGNQRDVDLFLAFRDPTQFPDFFIMVILEAKAYGQWTKEQMLPKVQRLRSIFGEEGSKHPRVKPHFFLIDPNPPKEIQGVPFPEWMVPGGRLRGLKLRLPKGSRRLIVNRTDRIEGKDRYQNFVIKEA